MTDEMMNLRALVEKTPDAVLLREMIGFAAQRLMELEVEGLTGAGYGEKTPDRLIQRNVYRDRTREIRDGTVELRIPKSAPTARSKRRTDVVGIGGAILLEQNDEWVQRGRYMTLETIAPLSNKHAVSLPAIAS
jgi:hypothetical protein